MGNHDDWRQSCLNQQGDYLRMEEGAVILSERSNEKGRLFFLPQFHLLPTFTGTFYTFYFLSFSDQSHPFDQQLITLSRIWKSTLRSFKTVVVSLALKKVFHLQTNRFPCYGIVCSVILLLLLLGVWCQK